MMRKNVVFIALCLLGFGLTGVMAQQAISASGGKATGPEGSVSYTIGQVAYTTISSTSGTITQGVQQPYEILEVGIDEIKGIALKCVAFPNPTIDFLKLTIEDYPLEHLSYQLYDLNGKLISKEKISSNESSVDMGKLTPTVYLLQITDKNKLIKTFKITKN